MSENSKIEWTHHTFNPWWGCVRVSPGCEHCYAETFSKRVGLKVWGATAERRFFGAKHWAEPYKWDKAAEKAGERHRVFCASMADVCEDHRDPRIQSMLNGARRELARLIENTPNLDWLLLTKRIENFRECFPVELFTGHQYPKNIWPGTTCEDQPRYDARIRHLLELREFSRRFISYEPALGPIDFRMGGMSMPDYAEHNPLAKLDWLIYGGESGGNSRPNEVAWARSARKQCAQAGTAFLLKQLGAVPLVEAGRQRYWDWRHVQRPENKLFTEHERGLWRLHLNDRKGGDLSEWPEDLRVRQFPEARS